ncbi:hypothetical protein Ccrd_018054 [Cynara cardunculus var. scolymus]|uniref:Uncharacterized protein n=1 Tax=Cynara cardunculus var. scolymus TaxID=59895 RepID=A0A103Y6Y7_CYNCS|nr:hypothetical protein Ccrd_018054 [Cynara cardunculus var. scolymus]
MDSSQQQLAISMVVRPDFNRFHIRLLHFFLGNSNCENSVFHGCLHLIHLGILRQPESPGELPAAAFNPMPSIIIIFLLHVSLAADLKIGFEHMSFRGFLPIHTGVYESRGNIRGRWNWEISQRLPNVKFHIRLLHFFLGNSNCENSVFHGCLHLIHLGILRQPESPGVSFQSTRVFTKAEETSEEDGIGKSLKGSQMSSENGSKMLLRRPLKRLGMIDIF